MAELSAKAAQDAAFLRKAVGARFRGPFRESDGSWAVTLVRTVPTSSGPAERREHWLGETPDVALARARLVVENAMEKARGA